MVASAVGFQVRRHWTPFASTFAAFLSRAYDFVRMAAISRADIRLCGSHAGVSIGEDGPSQMALEDLASLRAVHGSTVLYPSDATSTSALVEIMADTKGISYMRTTRAATPVLYDADEEFQAGGSKTVLDGTDVTLVGAGITLHEALAAAERLAGEGISARVIDLYSVKPIDHETLVKAAQETGAIVTVEDHWKEGGIGEAVLAALAEHGASAAVRVLAVEDMPSSAKPEELLRAAEIDAEAIYAAATEIVKTKVEWTPRTLGRRRRREVTARAGLVTEDEDVDGYVGVDVDRAQVGLDLPSQHRFHALFVDRVGGGAVDRAGLAHPVLLARPRSASARPG